MTGTAAVLPSRTSPNFPAALILVAVAIATRAVAYGNPLVELDSQFYLLVGDAVRHGQWPYIDIWDRKPVGLFMLFAAIATLTDASIPGMQLIATLFAAATAMVVRQVALRITSPRGALLAGAAYLLMLPSFGGQSGQSPVYYNLLMVTAFALLTDAAGRPARAIRGRALGAMLLCGVTLTLKPVSLLEGVFIGLAFLWLLHRAAVRPAAIVGTAAAMLGVALAPSWISIAVYAAQGPAALDTYIYANFVSIFQKQSLGAVAKSAGLAYFALYMGPLLLFAGMGARKWQREGQHAMLLQLAVGWAVAAVLGYLLVPNFFDHYALPLVAPLCVLAAPVFGRRDGWLFFGVVAVACLVQGAIVDVAGNRRQREAVAALGNRIDQARHGGCLFVAEGPAWLYRQSAACRLTRYQFPGHLLLLVETRALGIDQSAELARVLAARPAVIVTQDRQHAQHAPVADRLLFGTLAASYRPVMASPTIDGGPDTVLRVWQRRDLEPPPGTTTPSRR